MGSVALLVWFLYSALTVRVLFHLYIIWMTDRIAGNIYVIKTLTMLNISINIWVGN